MASGARGSEATSNSKSRVLIIDDEPGLADLLSRFLEFDKIPSVSFTDPIEALEWFRSHYSETEMVVLDMQMPQQTGQQCIKELKAIDPEVQVAIFSGLPNIKSRAPSDSSVVKVFQKPVEFSTVVNWISNCSKPKGPKLRVIYPKE